ncbi:MAG: DoxX family protein [Thermoplasmata archaeon]
MVLEIFQGLGDYGLLVLRVGIGLLFLYHGVPKLRSPKGTVQWLKDNRIPGAAVITVLVALLEFFGGIALILGFLTNIVAALFVVEMIGTSIFSKTKLGKQFMLGYELDILYLIGVLALVFAGAGEFSLDTYLGL